jgi:Ca2+-binding RTX toxin-like protein
MSGARRPAAGLTIAALAALAVCLTVDTARAGSASGRPAQFTAGAGERNDVSVDAGFGGAVQFTDAGAPVSPGLWCAPFPLGRALCDPDGDPRDSDGGGVRIDLGDRDDRALVRWVPGTDTHPGVLRVTGGPGNDHIENASNSVILLDGGDGDDTLLAGHPAGALLLGGAGADDMSSSADCCAIAASYADHDATGVRVTLDDAANDGLAGERDDVRTSGVIGSPGPDVLLGDDHDNALTGGGGADVLDGRGGNDTIDATLRGAAVGDAPDGPDSVSCGAGEDRAIADANDTVGIDCERIQVGLWAGPEVTQQLGAALADRAGRVAVIYRVRFPNPDNALASRSTLRLLDTNGQAASSIARFVLGAGVNVVRARVKLNRSARGRLARSRTGVIRLIAQRVSRDASPVAVVSGYELFNTPVTVRRASTPP